MRLRATPRTRPRPGAEEHNRLATDLDAHYATAGGYSEGSRLESIDDAQQRQLRRSRAKMNELPLRCCFQCACLSSNSRSSFSFKQSPLRVVLADARSPGMDGTGERC